MGPCLGACTSNGRWGKTLASSSKSPLLSQETLPMPLPFDFRHLEFCLLQIHIETLTPMISGWDHI